jgi:hypothetical protein
MAAGSRERAALARVALPEGELRARLRDRPAPPLRLSPRGFDLIAEMKLRSPARRTAARCRARTISKCAYATDAEAGAAAVLGAPPSLRVSTARCRISGVLPQHWGRLPYR